MINKLEAARAFLRSRSSVAPRVGLILGSGLGNVVDAIEADVNVPFGDIPHAPTSSVAGHSGRFIIGRSGATEVAVMQGRVHYYEGYTMEEVLFLPRLLALMGIKTLIVTNAAGGVNTSFSAGDLMLISDHINLFGVNPLRGKNVDELGPRFPDMSFAYPSELRETARKVAAEKGVSIKEGVYMGLSGPTYETPAEIRMFRTLGADAVGMSTVPEVIALSHMGVPALGISCITNMAAGILPQKLSHQEVMDTTARVQTQFTSLVLGLIEKLVKQ